MPIYHISSNGDFLPVDIIYLPDNVDFVRRIDKCTALFRYLARGTRKIYHLGFIAENRAVGKCTAVEPQNTIIGYAHNTSAQIMLMYHLIYRMCRRHGRSRTYLMTFF